MKQNFFIVLLLSATCLTANAENIIKSTGKVDSLKAQINVTISKLQTLSEELDKTQKEIISIQNENVNLKNNVQKMQAEMNTMQGIMANPEFYKMVAKYTLYCKYDSTLVATSLKMLNSYSKPVSKDAALIKKRIELLNSYKDYNEEICKILKDAINVLDAGAALSPIFFQKRLEKTNYYKQKMLGNHIRYLNDVIDEANTILTVGAVDKKKLEDLLKKMK